MSDQRINPNDPLSGENVETSEKTFDDEFAAQRSKIEQMVADPSRDATKGDEIRRLAEDLRERVPAHRFHEFAPFFKGIEHRLSERGASTGETGTPSALATGGHAGGSINPPGGNT